MRLSVCMMVRNEEANLTRCLASFMRVEGFCDQLVVVDTGSEDGTVEIAKRYGAEVRHHPWRDDFGWARNKSIKYANGDWLVTLDADEELIGNADDFMRLRADLASEAKFNCFTIPSEDIVSGQITRRSNAPRIFRSGKVRFESTVHNNPIVEGGQVSRLISDGLKILHHGYDVAPGVLRKKLQRTSSLLKKRIADNPKDWEAYFYLAQTYAYYGDIEACLKTALTYWKHRGDIKRFNWAIMPLITEIYINQKKLDPALQMIRFGMERHSLDVDMCWMYMKYAMEIGDARLLAEASERYIVAYNNFSHPASIAERGSRFVFHYSLEKYALALSTSSINSLKIGMDRLNQFGNVVTEHPETFKDIAQSLQQALLNIGIEWKHDNLINPSKQGDMQWDRQKMQ